MDHPVKKVPDAGEMLFAAADAESVVPQLGKVLADILGGDAREFETPLLAPGEKAIDGSSVGGAGVFVADAGVVKLLSGEDSRLAGAVDDVGQGGYLGFGSQDESVRGVGRGGLSLGR